MIEEIVNKIKSIFMKDIGKGYQRPVAREYKVMDEQSMYATRRSKLQKAMQMALQDVRVSRLLYKLSADVFSGGLDITIDSVASKRLEEDAYRAIDTVLKIILEKGESWTKALLRDGDVFLELVVNDRDELVNIKKLSPFITFSRMDEYGRFPDDRSPYYQENPVTRAVICEFEAWQVVQISWDREDGEPYGNGIFFSSQLAYDRLVQAEKNLAIRRQARAGKRLLYKIGTVDKPSRWDQVEEFIRMNKDAFDNPLNPVQDIWSNGLVDIKEIDSDRDIGQLSDIMYLEGLLPMQAGVPKALLGREENVNRDVLEEQEEDYFRVVADVSRQLEIGFRKIIDFALLLNGVEPSAVVYTFRWGNRDRSDLNDRIRLAKELQALGYSFETIFKFLNLEGTEYEEEIRRIREQVEAGIIPYGLNMKLDPNVMAMLSMREESNNDKDIKILL